MIDKFKKHLKAIRHPNGYLAKNSTDRILYVIKHDDACIYGIGWYLVAKPNLLLKMWKLL